MAHKLYKSLMRLIMVGATLSAAVPTNAQIFNPKTAKLTNGFEVVLIENHLAPVVSIALTYRIGTADDPRQIAGVSHFLEHLMFKGTKKVPSNQFTQRIINKGGRINAFTTQDLTCYTCDISVEHLDMVLEMEADRMHNLEFVEKETLSELKVVLEERKMRLDNNPLGRAYEKVQRALHIYHPYGVPTIGYPQHIEAYTNKNAKEHYYRWYVPNNATLVISGDITMDELLPMVKKHFESIPSRPLTPRVRAQDPDDNGVDQIIKVESPRISYVSYDFYYKGPKYSDGGHKDYYFLSVLLQILGGNATSRLYKDLVDGRHLALDASASHNLSIDPQHIEITASLHPERKPEELKKALEEHIKNIVEKGVTELELKAAKRDLLADLAYSRDGNSGAINTFRNLAYGLTVDDIESYSEKINNITVADVNQVAKTYLGGEPSLVTKVTPQGYKEPNGDKNREKKG